METFLSADESRINLWNLERRSEPVYSLIEYKRNKVKSEDEAITRARFSADRNMFLYATSFGNLHVCDLREASSFHSKPSLSFSLRRHAQNSQNVFDPWLNCISDASFLPGSSPQLVSRDYLSVRLWDMRTASSSAGGMVVDSAPNVRPVYTAQVTDYMERNLANLYHNSNIADQFFLELSPDGRHMATGAYNKSAHVLDINCTSNKQIACRYDQTWKDPVHGALRVYGKHKRLVASQSQGSERPPDLKKRVRLGTWSPASH